MGGGAVADTTGLGVGVGGTGAETTGAGAGVGTDITGAGAAAVGAGVVIVGGLLSPLPPRVYGNNLVSFCAMRRLMDEYEGGS